MNIVKQAIVIGFGALFNIVISFLTTPIITRIVDPTEYGQFGLFTTYTGIIASFCYIGLNDALIRFYYECKNINEKRSLLKLCFLIPIFMSFLVLVIGIILFKIGIVKIDLPFIVVVLLFINVICSVWNAISNVMLQSVQNGKMYSFASMLQKTLYCLTTILLIFFLKNYYLYILIFSTILSVISSALVGTITTKEHWNFTNIKLPNNLNDIAKYSLPFYVYFVIYSIYDVVDKLFIKHFCGEYDLGIYTSVYSIIGFFAIVQTAFNVIWKPIQTEHYTNNSNDTTLISKGNRYMTIIMVLAGLSVIMFKDILCLFLGEEYRIGSTVIPFLVFNPIMNTLIGTATSGIEKSNKMIIRVFIILVSLVSLGLGCTLLIPKIGIKGAAISIALSLIIQYLLTIYFSNKFYYVDYGLKKSLLVIFITIVFAYINTFYKVTIYTCIIYVISMILVIYIYRIDVLEMIKYLLQSLKKD